MEREFVMRGKLEFNLIFKIVGQVVDYLSLFVVGEVDFYFCEQLNIQIKIVFGILVSLVSLVCEIYLDNVKKFSKS